jgi:hypothetical protein
LLFFPTLHFIPPIAFLVISCQRFSLDFPAPILTLFNPFLFTFIFSSFYPIISLAFYRFFPSITLYLQQGATAKLRLTVHPHISFRLSPAPIPAFLLAFSCLHRERGRPARFHTLL